MNVIRPRLHLFGLQSTVRRGIRKLRPRHVDLEKPVNPISSTFNIPALQTPLTEQDLLILSKDGSQHDTKQAKKPAKEKGKSLQEKVSPRLNQPMKEPVTAENQYEKLAEVVTPLYRRITELEYSTSIQ
ncbi:uncharacterized protein [Palaemon carinicauda]|uniref:uncharacterized protein n=1 Tax=Palaemon carinicauda TaxID=392227 RepID=UPI0035B59A5F